MGTSVPCWGGLADCCANEWLRCKLAQNSNERVRQSKRRNILVCSSEGAHDSKKTRPRQNTPYKRGRQFRDMLRRTDNSRTVVADIGGELKAKILVDLANKKRNTDAVLRGGLCPLCRSPRRRDLSLDGASHHQPLHLSFPIALTRKAQRMGSRTLPRSPAIHTTATRVRT